MKSMYKKDFFSQGGSWVSCHLSVSSHACSMSHVPCVCLYYVVNVSMLSMSMSMLLYSFFLYPIILIDKVIESLSSLCNNKQRCFPYCFGDVISVNSLSKTELEQVIYLFFLLEHIPSIILNN